MQFGSKVKRNIFTGAALGLVPDILISVVAASITDTGLIGFFVILFGLQVVYFLIWAKKAIWIWLLFFFRGRKQTTDHMFQYLRSNRFPEPGEYQEDVDDYLANVMRNERIPVDTRLKAAVEQGSINALRVTGQGTQTLQAVMAFEDAIIQYKRTFPPRRDQAENDDEFDEDEFDQDQKAALDVNIKCAEASKLIPESSDHSDTRWRPFETARNEAVNMALDIRTEFQVGHAAGIAGNTFAVERDRRCGKPSKGVHDPRHALGVLVAAPGKHANAIAFHPADESVAVVLDFMHPLLSGRHGLAEGRQAWLDEAGGVTDGSEGAPEHGPFT
jgi:hypothetical protein